MPLLRRAAALLAALLLAAPAARAQVPARDSAARDSTARDALRPDSVRAEPGDTADADDADDRAADSLAAAFFADRRPLELVVTANLGALRRQRDDENNPWRAAALSYQLDGASPVALEARIRTRGLFRRRECEFPPIRLRFTKKAREGTVFEGLRRPKVVTYCRNHDDFEQYVLLEYLVYRLHEVVTPMSLGARRARVTYVDSASAKPGPTRAGIVLEEEARLARRLGGKILEAHGAKPHHLDPYQATVMAVFQYMIGNTDWSVSGLHNIVLVQTPLTIYPVAYDFDFSGIVRARYAAPDPKLGITQVTERLYRGTCATNAELPAVLDHFRAKRAEIYAVLDEPIGLRASNARRVRGFLDDFFEIIEDRGLVKRFLYDRCVEMN